MTRSRIHVVPLGIDFDGHERAGLDSEPFTIGYLARIAPEKGLHVLCEAYRRLRATPGLPPSRLAVAGYLAPEHRGYFDGIQKQMASWGLAGHLDYVGAPDRAGKLAFLKTLSVLSVPSPRPTQKGQFLLEAMASGVPVVQPRLGVFTEVVEQHGRRHPDRGRRRRRARARPSSPSQRTSSGGSGSAPRATRACAHAMEPRRWWRA